MRRALVVLLLVACSSSSTTLTSSTDARKIRPFEWRRWASMPTPRTEVAAALLVDGQIVVAGGFAAPSDTVATVEIYDAPRDTWATGPPLPIAVNHAMGASLSGTAYILGGYASGGGPSSEAFALDKMGEWDTLPPMPEPRAAGGAAVAGGKIYVVGGVGSSGLAISTLVYDPATQSWSTTSGLLRPREHLGVASFANRVYAIGGRIGSGNLAAAEVLDPATGQWRALPDMPTARGGLAAAAIPEGFVVAVGGEELGEDGTTFEEVEAFGTRERRWVTLPDLPSPRHGLAAVGLFGVYALAGGPDPGLAFSGTVESIRLDKLASARCLGKGPTIVGSPGRDTLLGNGKRDVVLARGGSDLLRGEGGADALCGGGSDDRLIGGQGKDRLDGGAGSDRCVEPGPAARRRGCER